MFSKACEYAIRSVIYIGVSSLKQQRVGFKEIASAIDAPEAFTAKILQKLSKAGIIDSIKGVGGGFELALQKSKQIKLREIVELIDSPKVYSNCALGLAQCSQEHPCPVHDQFKSIREELAKMLENTTLYDLSTGTYSGKTFLRL